MTLQSKATGRSLLQLNYIMKMKEKSHKKLSVAALPAGSRARIELSGNAVKLYERLSLIKCNSQKESLAQKKLKAKKQQAKRQARHRKEGRHTQTWRGPHTREQAQPSAKRALQGSTNMRRAKIKKDVRQKATHFEAV